LPDETQIYAQVISHSSGDGIVAGVVRHIGGGSANPNALIFADKREKDGGAGCPNFIQSYIDLATLCSELIPCGESLEFGVFDQHTVLSESRIKNFSSGDQKTVPFGQ
jgi:hypothetical protein